MIKIYTMEEYRQICIELLDDIKGRLGQDKFDEFGKILIDYNAKRIEIADYIEKVKELFEGHRDLLSRFKIFMPKKQVKMEDAIRFLNKIKAKLEGVDHHTYKSFMHILIMYHNKQKSFSLVCQEVTTLLQGHPELLDEFYDFLPKAISARYIAARYSVRRDI